MMKAKIEMKKRWFLIILVSNKINNNLNIETAKKYIDWITSKEAKKLINNYRVNGKQLFFFNHN